jgi:hypothetical protein
VGVIPILSGEEVTVTGIKSTLCMLLCLYLLAIWLAVQKGRRKAAARWLQKLQQLPETVFQVISDGALTEFSKELAQRSARSYAAIVLDALDPVCAGFEAASKLEEMSWSAVGLALDYQDVQPDALDPDVNKNLILVNATSKARFTDALGLMKALNDKALPFSVVTYSNRELRDMKRLANGNVVCLPKTDDAIQPMIDLVFYYQFAFHYGLAHGRNAEDFPRNRVKSVTASRSSPWLTWTAAKEILHLKERYRMRAVPNSSKRTRSAESAWMRHADHDWERGYYNDMLSLAEVLNGAAPLDGLLDLSGRDRLSMTNRTSEIIAKEGDVLLVPLDRKALAASLNLASNLRRILGCSLKVVSKNHFPPVLRNNTLSIVVSTTTPDENSLSGFLKKSGGQHFWVGPQLPDELPKTMQPFSGAVRLKNRFRHNYADVIYMGLMLLFARAWEQTQPDRAKTLIDHIQNAGAVIKLLQKKVSLKKDLNQTLRANSTYNTAFFLGPPVGAGIFWSEIMKESNRLILASHPFGKSVYGPIVTVDSRVESKFVKLDHAAQMIVTHGKRKVSQWEKRYLGGDGLDAFLSQPMKDMNRVGPKPFYAEGDWYLPVLRNGYDTAEDNLIIIDATSERYFASAIDELATYGCRYGRLIVLTQAAFREDPDKKALYQYPISHMIELPALSGKNGDIIPISDFLLPFAINTLGVATAAG